MAFSLIEVDMSPLLDIHDEQQALEAIRKTSGRCGAPAPDRQMSSGDQLERRLGQQHHRHALPIKTAIIYIPFAVWYGRK